jgi:nucleoside-diphosphate-sugar epimerase
MKTIHISGATGYLGSKLCEHYLQKGFLVNALIRSESKNKLTDKHKSRLLKFTEVDFENLGDLDFEMNPDDVLIHTASINTRNVEPSFETLVKINIEYGLKLMSKVGQTKGKFLNIGTNWQHFKNNVYSPVSLYAASKQAHLAFQAYFEEVEGLQAKNLELCDTYGPDDPRDKLIPLLLCSEKEKWPIELTSGIQLIDLVHIDDVVNSISLIIENWEIPEMNSNMSLTSDNLISVKDLVGLCGEVRGQVLPVIWGMKQPLYNRQMHESWAFHQLPHKWKPEVALRDGLTEVFTTVHRMREGVEIDQD